MAPLDIGYGGERVYGFVRDHDRLVSIGSTPCAFIALRFARASANEASQLARPNGPIRLVAMERKNARPDVISEADVVIVRPQTVFAASGVTS